MKHALVKALRFTWRAIRNSACILPTTRSWIFRPEALAARFGRGDAVYAWQVYLHHLSQLESAGFAQANAILEVGPGRNLGTSLLWWARAESGGQISPKVVLWDVFANAEPSASGYWEGVATSLLAASETTAAGSCAPQIDVLKRVASGDLSPLVEYRVCALDALSTTDRREGFDLIYSHAALEHVWEIDRCLVALAGLSVDGGWHSHRIDLADHGRRNSNFVEMLEWSKIGWWLTMRFVPGAINRRRAGEYESSFEQLGIRRLLGRREQREVLPIPRSWLSRPYRQLEDDELRTTALDFVGQRSLKP